MARPRATSLRTNSGVTKAGSAAPKLSPSARRLGLLGCARASNILAMGDIGHLLGDDAGARQFELRDGTAALAALRSTARAKAAARASRRSRQPHRCKALTCRRRGMAVAVGERDLAKRHGEIVMALRRGIDLAASGATDRSSPWGAQRPSEISACSSSSLPVASLGLSGAGSAIGGWEGEFPSLRRHDPDQVRRVSARALANARQRTLSPFPGLPSERS